MADEEEVVEKKKPTLVITIAAIAGLTLLAAGGGWFLGNMLAPPPAEKPAEEVVKAEGGAEGEATEVVPHISTEANGVVLLDPITSNLAYPSDNRVRLEVALMFKGVPDVKLAEEIHQDILAYMRTVSLQQVQGPRGFQYLREDLQERVDLRSEGRVTNVMFRTFVIE
ncbi:MULTISPECIES: flagellar basal body-associated FliL family protein [unclassified Shinella]|uniref:flagellar basal body-associated FliL family protein n=1 Tax=unclassified Shinella TaxID=2643062 RepID=UPI00225CFB87|nr:MULTISPECIES: flagellar basal body-associated FliL family protein [unclassified Shinella]MCO5136886.1 flagellar basal body-associated FliL family protein [Shinella sp.]MDC7253437.1 flagellar basal body-associated FliL family protein [Shinella sp. YE25]CAI0340925.1 Flagellar biosynthesis protein fliL [Rhizobiaceae bacterium]CAK7259271.1 flagellar FliL protein [Shinella sp. WSC3-e]